MKSSVNTAGQMVVASRLGDGRVVFLTPGGRWSDAIAAGALARANSPANSPPSAPANPSTREEAERLLSLARESEAANQVVEPYLIDVTEAGGVLRPVAWREMIRVAGPTVRTDLPAALPPHSAHQRR